MIYISTAIFIIFTAVGAGFYLVGAAAEKKRVLSRAASIAAEVVPGGAVYRLSSDGLVEIIPIRQ